MSVIQQLPSHVISLIAAGEIAEGPSGIIKELIENSLDAKASQIEISLEEAGLKKITVADNGHGMLPEDLPISVLSHATSKISQPKDLDAISSYGFRGEALASIAKVGNLHIISRHQDRTVAHQYQHDTRQLKENSRGMAIGTVIELKNLFAKIPARKKFLRKPTKELKQILDTVSKIALANPSVSFRVHHNTKQIVHFPAKQSLLDRFLQVTDWELANQLLPVSHADDCITISGYISHPTQTKSHTKTQWLFVNQRPVTHSGLSKTIKLSYKASIPPERHPLFVLNITLDPALFDINRHPKKETIAFMDEAMVQKIVSNTIQNTLLKEVAVSQEKYQTLRENNQTVFGTQHQQDTSTIQDNPNTYRGHFPAEKYISSTLKSLISPWKKEEKTTYSQSPILQIANTYLVTEHNGELILVDQHAAHERILYEKFRSLYMKEQNKEPQSLQPSINCNLTAQQTLLITEHLPYLEKIGFRGHFLGDTSFTITSAPPLIPIEQTKRILLDVLEDLAEGSPVSLVDGVAHRTIAYVACRSAIMAGDPLDQKERAQLLAELFESPNYQTCPHGRPTSITYSKSHLEKIFKRA